MDKIYTGNDRAKELKLRNYRELISYLCTKSGEHWKGGVNTSPDLAVYAFVDWGRWCAKCPDCGNQMYAEPTDAIMFCDSCGNVSANGEARSVIFPDNLRDIEAALLERGTEGSDVLREKMAGKFGASQLALNPLFRPTDISRNWNHGESAEDLRNEHARVKRGKQERERHNKDGE